MYWGVVVVLLATSARSKPDEIPPANRTLFAKALNLIGIEPIEAAIPQASNGSIPWPSIPTVFSPLNRSLEETPSIASVLPDAESRIFQSAYSYSPETKTPFVKAFEVQCEKSSMFVHIEFDSPFTGVIYSKGFYQQPECNYVTSGSGATAFDFHVPFDYCGSIYEDPSQYNDYQRDIYAENTLVIQFDENIQEVWDLARRIRCEWKSHYEKPVMVKPMQVAMIEPETFRYNGDNIEVWMQIQRGKGPWAEEVYGVVKIGEPLTIVIGVKDRENKFDMMVKDCFATDGYGRTVQLTDYYGCVLREKIMQPFEKRRENGPHATVLAFAYISAFKFPDEIEVGIKCNIQVCRHECSAGCPAYTKSFKTETAAEQKKPMEAKKPVRKYKPGSGASVRLPTVYSSSYTTPPSWSEYDREMTARPEAGYVPPPSLIKPAFKHPKIPKLYEAPKISIYGDKLFDDEKNFFSKPSGLNPPPPPIPPPGLYGNYAQRAQKSPIPLPQIGEPRIRGDDLVVPGSPALHPYKRRKRAVGNAPEIDGRIPMNAVIRVISPGDIQSSANYSEKVSVVVPENTVCFGVTVFSVSAAVGGVVFLVFVAVALIACIRLKSKVYLVKKLATMAQDSRRNGNGGKFVFVPVSKQSVERVSPNQGFGIERIYSQVRKN